MLSAKATKTVLSQLAYGIVGFMLSGGAVFGVYAPFGSSIISAVPIKRLIATLVGVIAGYLVITPGSSFRYIATVIAISAIRWTLSDLKRITSSTLYPVLLAGIPMLATGIMLSAVGNYQISLVVMAVIESILASVGAYFYYRTVSIIRSTKGISSLNNQEIACLIMSGCIFLLALSSIGFGGVSIGRICAILIILICARKQITFSSTFHI